MATTTTSFNPAVLLSPESAQTFLNGEKALQEIRRFTPATATSTAHGRTWNSSWIDLNEIHYHFSSFVLTLASYLLSAACMTGLSRKTWVMSRHAMDNALVIRTNKVFQENLLSRSINTHRLDSSDYYQKPTMRIPFDTIPDTGLNFFHEDGMCRGMCFWFVSLYFKTLGQFPNVEQHLSAVGQQFSQGAPREAAFLQSMDPDKPALYDLLRLNNHFEYSKIRTTGKTIEQILREFYVRLPGVYGIYTSTHNVIYIKIDENRQYLFDPNKGCIRIASTELFKKAMESYFESHDNSKEIVIDKYTPR
jgi:hypothetical protein